MRSQLLMLFISRRRLCRAGEKARLMLTRRISLGRFSNIAPLSVSTLSMLLFKGLMVLGFLWGKLVGLEGCLVVLGDWRLGTGTGWAFLYRISQIRNPKSEIRNAYQSIRLLRRSCMPLALFDRRAERIRFVR